MIPSVWIACCMCGLPEHRGIEHTSLNSMRIAPYEIIPMIQTDSLEAALAKVPRLASVLGNQVEPDYPALAVAAREWMRQQLPGSITAEWAKTIDGYDAALADVTKALGLTP